MLAGQAIVITRPASQAPALARMIEQIGAKAIIFPALEILPVAASAAMLTHVQAADMAIFISANAVEYGLRQATLSKHLALAAIGQATSAALKEAGYRNIISPTAGADSEALLAEPALLDVVDKRIVIFRGVGGRETLRVALTQRGAQVNYIECYRRSQPDVSAATVAGLVARDDIAGVQAFSRETLTNFCAMIGVSGVAKLSGKPLFVPHLAIAEAARGLGFDESIVTGFGDAGLLAALEQRFGQ
ncbi:MAG: uroporphyrinogen-III synthase [Burkholderiales bacterium]